MQETIHFIWFIIKKETCTKYKYHYYLYPVLLNVIFIYKDFGLSAIISHFHPYFLDSLDLV